MSDKVLHTYHDVTPEQAKKLIEALNKSDDRENIKDWLNAVLDILLNIGDWNDIEVIIQPDNSRGDRVDYEDVYGNG